MPDDEPRRPDPELWAFRLGRIVSVEATAARGAFKNDEQWGPGRSYRSTGVQPDQR